MSDPNDNSIPVLHDILVPGHAAEARQTSNDAAAPATQPATEPELPQEPGFKAEPVLAPQPAHVHEPTPPPEPAPSPEQRLSPQPVRGREPAVVPEPASAPATAHATEPAPAAEPHGVEHPHPKKRSRLHHGAEARHAHDDAYASAGVFDRAEPAAPLEVGTIVPPDLAHETAAPSQPDLDADAIAERLRGRFAGFLAGGGRDIIEARCRDALQEHGSRLVSQITREVALTLETEMTGWVREAVEEEIARRSGRA